MRRLLLWSIPIAVITMSAASAVALPRFSARTGAKCQSCHVNPTGAEMRQTYGVQYGRDQLPVPEWSKDFQMEDFSNLITNVLGVGADFRTIYFSRMGDTAHTNGFFQMQGDIYLNFKVAKKVSLFINKGLYSGFEIFGLFHLLPADGYVKVGKFIPAFGTKLDDHTAYIRTYTGFSPEQGRPERTGAEVAISPGPFTLIGGVYNAADAYGSAQGNEKAFLGRGEGMFSLSDDFHLGLGADIYTWKTLAGYSTSLYGGLGSVSYKNYTIFGEYDWIKNNQQSGVSGTVLYVEGDFMVIQGVDLKLAYDFYDPDKDVKNGAYSRYTFGVEFFPLSGVEVRPLYRYTKIETVDKKFSEVDVVLHIYV